ncbi:hypothetical protein F5I97DRAFT_1984715 [Phlebopus sp. FC_14]|nr:hypothetical protein F5I97DRAFT_1984715 [Phlebopus sp. FC_14]
MSLAGRRRLIDLCLATDARCNVKPHPQKARDAVRGRLPDPILGPVLAAGPPRPRTALMVTKIPPSISRLFYTNCVPSPMDAQHIHELLAERNQELSVVNEELQRARVEVHRLECRRDQVKEVVDELEALMSPVRRMPTDIMAKVFELCVLDQDMPRCDPCRAPLVLGQVCRSWRDLIFALPCLWSALRVDFSPGARDWESVMQSKIMAMHVWLSRSKSLPISLLLNHYKGSHIPWAALMLLDKEILTLSCRLKELTLYFSPACTCLPHHVHTSNSLPPSNENPDALILHSAPKSPELEPLLVTKQAHSGTLFTVITSQSSLNARISLRATSVSALSFHDFDSGSIQPVTLPKLHTVKCNAYVQTTYLQYFFNALRLPQLRTFDIKNVSLALGSITGQTDCLPLLLRSADTLEAVSFERMDIDDSALLLCVAQLPHLKTLYFLPGTLRLNHNLVTALTHSSNAVDFQRILPHLETLQLRCSSVLPVDAAIGLVESRCQSEPRLKQFSLQLASFEYGLDTRDEKIREIQARLQVYVDQGLQLVLTKSGASRWSFAAPA